MGNPYGCNLSVPLPALYAPSGDVACPSGTETTVITTGALSATTAGLYYPYISGVLTVYLGATAPSALVIAFKIGAGAHVASFVVDPGQLVNSAKVVLPFVLVGANSGTAYGGAGSTINITLKGTGQDTTCKQVGSVAFVALQRGPDA